MTNILTRYQSFKKTEKLIRVNVHEKLASEYRDVCTADELTEIIQRHLEENNIKLLDIIGLNQLEQQFGSFLEQVLITKTQLNMEVVKDLQDKIKQARMNGISDDSSNGEQRQLPVMDIHVIRMTNILTRYQSFKKTEKLIRVNVHEKLASEYRDVCTADELTEIIQRHLEENNIKLLDIIGLNQLEQQFGSFLEQVLITKTQLNMEVVKDLQDKIKQARMNGISDDSSNGEQRQLPVMDIHVIR